MNIKKISVTCSFVLLLLFAGMSTCRIFGQTPRSQSDMFTKAYKEFKTIYESELRQHKIVGSSFAMIHDNQVIAKDFYGLANIEQNRAVDENTIYHWASITKTFTGIAIMQLRDRGLLRLDDPVIKYLPELKAVHNPYGDMSEITIKHLLTHSAGFRDATWTWRDDDKDWQPFEPQRWEQLVAMMPYTEILFKPGSKYSYSNPGYIFLGRIIELLTHDDYEVYIDKNILKPLEMYRSYFDTTPYHLLKYRSHSYYLREGKPMPARFDADTGITVSNGGLNASFPDMVKYVNFLLGDPRNQTIYDEILKRSSLEEMWHPQIQISKDTFDGVTYTSSMGLTFFIDNDSTGDRVISHTGDQNAFTSSLDLRPKTHAASLLAYNTEVQQAKDTLPWKAKIRQNLFKLFQSLEKTGQN